MESLNLHNLLRIKNLTTDGQRVVIVGLEADGAELAGTGLEGRVDSVIHENLGPRVDNLPLALLDILSAEFYDREHDAIDLGVAIDQDRMLQTVLALFSHQMDLDAEGSMDIAPIMALPMGIVPLAIQSLLHRLNHLGHTLAKELVLIRRQHGEDFGLPNIQIVECQGLEGFQLSVIEPFRGKFADEGQIDGRNNLPVRSWLVATDSGDSAIVEAGQDVQIASLLGGGPNGLAVQVNQDPVSGEGLSHGVAPSGLALGDA